MSSGAGDTQQGCPVFPGALCPVPRRDSQWCLVLSDGVVPDGDYCLQPTVAQWYMVMPGAW